MAHAHAEDQNTYYLEQLCTIGICGLIGGVTALMYRGHLPDPVRDPCMLRFMVAVYLHPYVFAGGIAMVGLVIVRAVIVWRMSSRAAEAHGHGHEHCHDDEHGVEHIHGPECEYDHGHDHVHEHAAGGHEHEHDHDPAHSPGDDHGHGHDHSWNPWRYTVLLLPVVLFFLGLPNGPLRVRARNVNASDFASGSSSKLVENTGMRITKNETQDLIQVVSVSKDGAADKAGLKANDDISQITREFDEEGKPLAKPEVAAAKGMLLEKAVELLKGKPQTKVKVTVERSSGEPQTLEITRSADIKNVAFNELKSAAFTEQSREFWSGKIARLKGQYSPSGSDVRIFSLVRIKMTCCAADAYPLDVVIMLDPNAKGSIAHIKPQQWVEVTGEIQFRKRKGRDEYATILWVSSPADVKESDPDMNPYIQ
jgi:hypothetical protein